jgi:hypothetical protein
LRNNESQPSVASHLTVTCRDFFLGRDFRNLGGNRIFHYPPRNCSTGQKNSANLNLKSDPGKIKNVFFYDRIGLCVLVVRTRTGIVQRMVVCSTSRVGCIFCSLFLIFVQKNWSRLQRD